MKKHIATQISDYVKGFKSSLRKRFIEGRTFDTGKPMRDHPYVIMPETLFTPFFCLHHMANLAETLVVDDKYINLGFSLSHFKIFTEQEE
jgi:hypothetical protein